MTNSFKHQKKDMASLAGGHTLPHTSRVLRKTFRGLNVIFPGSAGVKNLPVNAGDPGVRGLIPGWRRSPRGRHGNPLQCSCLGNLMERGAWRATVHGVSKESYKTATEQAHT